MIFVSPAIPDDLRKIISIASRMKSVSEAVFSIPQMIINVTARILTAREGLLSVTDRTLSVTAGLRFRDGNDLICDGKDYLRDIQNHGIMSTADYSFCSSHKTFFETDPLIS